MATRRWRPSFKEIEKILGFSLPASARAYPAWWANDEKSHPQKLAWLDAGWRTEELDLAGERITFCRGNSTSTGRYRRKSTQTHAAQSSETSIRDVPWPWDAPTDVECSVSFSWQPIGRVGLDQKGKLLFPSVQQEPGVYRLRLKAASRTREYIGESDNVSRRFGNYRQGDPRQQTSHRIYQELHKALQNGEQISVALMRIQKMSRDDRSELTACDLSTKASRCFLEHLALVLSNGKDIESLNR